MKSKLNIHSSDRERIQKRLDSESPAFSDADLGDVNELSSFRGMCDFCKDTPEPVTGGALTCVRGGGVTFVNADKLVHLRYMPELALKLYNDDKLQSFKLLKVCKINSFGAGFYGLTFRAQDDGSEECPTFRGIVRVVGRKKEALFCEIKDDDEITLLPPGLMMTTAVQNKLVKVKIAPLAKAENDVGDGAAADFGDSSVTGSDVEWRKFERRYCH